MAAASATTSVRWWLVRPKWRVSARSGDFGRLRLERLRRAALVQVFILSLVALSVPAALAGPPVAVATFDALPEGTVAPVLTDGGITFFGLDQRIPEFTGTYVFVVDQADVSQLGPDGFTPPNVLSWGGFVPGPGASFGRVGEFRISPPNGGNWASLELWVHDELAGNVVTLEAIRRGVVVATDAVTLSGGDVVRHFTLTVSGKRFDELRVVGSGDADMGVFFGVIDSVRIGRGRLPETG
jgi:hypothetical protein